MASPKVLVQILVSGTRILGKAFLEAGRQAVKNAKATPQGALQGDVAGVGNATSGSASDQLTRQHRMTLDEAHLILNVKQGEEMEQVMKKYEHLFKANSPVDPPPKPKVGPNGKPIVFPSFSHYLQSKVVRARERIEAEIGVPEKPLETTPSANPTAPPPPPPPEAPGPGSGGAS